jgi:hypothetical protein
MRTVLKWVLLPLAGMVVRIVERNYGGFRVQERRRQGTMASGLDCLKVMSNKGLVIEMAGRAEVEFVVEYSEGRGKGLKAKRARWRWRGKRKRQSEAGKTMLRCLEPVRS